MTFDPMKFVENLPYILKGELGTFIALGIIALSVVILNKVSHGDDDDVA
ncbi:MAG: hypothetical protein IJM79_00160 [Erysipelotrichaceae bacterium]|nr:hypothetical protein [Erysipelotrichaceae bacterium]